METWQWIKAPSAVGAKRLSSSEQGQGNVSNLPRSGRLSRAVTPATMQRADSHIRNDRRITSRGTLCGDSEEANEAIPDGSSPQRCDKSASSPRQCEATHESAYRIGHHKASVDCPASSTVQPGSGSFRLPSFQSFQRCNPRKEVWGRRGSHFRSKEVVVTETCRVLPRRHTCCHISVA
jgi:hypothetical protein